MTLPSWAGRAALGEGSVVWRPHAPPLHREATPLPGTRMEAQVRYPFSAGLGETVPALFTPGGVDAEGWDDALHLLEQVAVVDAVLLADHGEETARRGQHRVALQIEAALPLSVLGRTFPSRPVPDLGRCMVYGPASFPAPTRTVWERWTLLSWSAQGDVGGWLILEEEQRLVLAGEWDAHLAVAYAGCGEVTPADRALWL